ncbi:MAG TPA: YitT family protein [bacterium (Candidatus Stahlbacteria)]|nr:YitT family protein [Candidatus Stahlbacteria bacterium]
MKRLLPDLLLILFGSIIIGLTYNLFLIPHRLVPGGVGGLSIIIHHLAGSPVGVLIIIFNIPLFIIGVKVLGRSYGIKTLLGITLSAVFIDLFAYTVKITAASDNRILSAVYGGAILGIGLGLVFRGHGSTGGTDIIGQVINHYTDLSIGIGILIIDFIIISFAGIIFKDFELSLYGYLTLFISSKVIDLVIEGWSYTRALLIITTEKEKISDVIIKRFNRGVTELAGKGAYSKEERPVLFCVASKREVQLIIREIKEIDNQAFVVVTDVYEVLGHGFHPRL